MSSIVTTTEGLTRPPRSLWHDAWRRLVANRLARLGMAITVFFILLAVAVPVVFPYNARTDSDLVSQLLPPSAQHLMGTDEQGRDVLNRVAQGARASLGVGVSSVLIAILVGALLGLFSGFAGKTVDLVIMFAMDVLLSFPGLLLAIAVVALLGPGLRNALLAITIVNIPVDARIARSTVLSVKQFEYINAARSVGAPSGRILFRHVLPNSLSPILVQSTLGIAGAILEIAALGFLGLGQQPPYPEWGAMLADSVKYLTSGAWWVLLFPGLAIMLTVLGFNLLGDGLRDALDPRLRA
ncbi:MAG: ABC transporter permease [Chloroflexi bacterium]|nr:ABC transporter permease [Chloroflexota bacterium]